MTATEMFATVGEKFSSIMTNLISFLAKLGLDMSETQGKILNLVILLGLALGIMKVVEKPIKWLFITLIVLLAVSIGISFIP